MRKFVLLVCALLLCGLAQAMSVTFINPGKHDEIYWLTASRAMQAAADDLGVQLEVLYAERIHPHAVEFAREIAARPKARRPDYVILSNDYGTAPEILKLLDGAGIRTFLAFSGRGDDKGPEPMGAPRTQFHLWLGSLEPHAEDAGYQSARALIQKGRKAGLPRVAGKLQLIAIGGDRSTPTSMLRDAGMRRAVAEAGDVELVQEVYAAWTRERSAEQSEWLYKRYPQARLVWAGNDLMAFGAMDTWRKQGGTPGKDALFSGINTSAEAMQALRDGSLTALSGGHFIAGAWSLVMLYDYDRGIDFAPDGLEQDRSMFTLFDATSAERFMRDYGNLDFSHVDFRRYSKALNPRLKHYDFSFKQLLK
ncbi:ABC transporter substrate-binding protein [Vogesella sp. LIG4]|uniref:ABC transporter substrate-binding protein n=1 Tax=Vogesella sp. LIG4 TaxID=1192162 RepID=UPI00081FB1AC|nr:ABC transporter substrate-binding protein [Vogesella sp. LIG4]SCK22500.1 monosaccharide ABC transporter substrate-binding protein, CUT2 family [Vogesella sp. LIG4]